MDGASHYNLPDLDTRLLSNFVYEINIARRHMTTYPPGHPMIARSTDKVLLLLDRLFEFRPAIGFGIARKALMFEGEWLDRKNPVYRDFAAFLFSRGIAAIHFMRHAERDEVIRLNQLLRSERAEIHQYGGYAKLLEAQQITHIKLIQVDYSLFTTVEEERISRDDYDAEKEPLWENFLLGMMEGILDPEGSSLYMPADFDPRLVAGILNRKAESQGMTGKENYDAVISSFINQIDGKKTQQTKQKLGPSEEDIGTLIQELNPQLRRQFLNSTFRNLDTKEEQAEKVLGAFPEALIVESLNQVNQQELKVSGSILNLLGKLSKHQTAGHQSSTIQGESHLDQTETDARMRLLFREEDNSIFIPEAYQNALNTIVSSEQVTLLKDEEMSSLRAMLDSQSIERQTCAIAFELMPEATSELEETLQRNMVDLARFFLETGDFVALEDLYVRWSDYLNRDEMATFFLAEEVLGTLHSTEFINETLDALARFGSEKQGEVRQYILTVGSPFSDELIRRLATAESMTMRRYYMSCLTEMRGNAHDAIMANLADDRWYLVRNLIIIIAQQKESQLVKKIYPLINFHHPRVHQEVLKLMFTYNRPRAERQLLEELSSPSMKTQLYAAQLADHSQEKATHRQLIKVLRDAPLNEEGLALKTQILKTLAKIGDAGTIAILEALISSGNLIHPRLFRKLKNEAIGTLSQYPAAAAEPLLKKLAANTNGDTASIAREQLRLLRRRSE